MSLKVWVWGDFSNQPSLFLGVWNWNTWATSHVYEPSVAGYGLSKNLYLITSNSAVKFRAGRPRQAIFLWKSVTLGTLRNNKVLWSPNIQFIWMKSKCLKLGSDDIRKIDLKRICLFGSCPSELVPKMLSALKSVLSLTWNRFYLAPALLRCLDRGILDFSVLSESLWDRKWGKFAWRTRL